MSVPTPTPSRPFQWRAMTSVVIAFCFLALVLSGVMLFVAPPGRVANWTNWTILGLRKHDWSAVHIWFGASFICFAVLHLIFNWRPLVSYFKDRATRQLGWRREWIAGLALCALVAAGTLVAVPPFSSLIAWNEALRESWEQPATVAPIPHAELLTLAELAEKSGVPLEMATSRLEARGYGTVAAGSTVMEIAEAAGVSPQQIHATIRSGGSVSGVPAGPGGGGPGRKTLAQFCAEEGIPIDTALARLSSRGFEAAPELTLREIANANGQEKPYELVRVIRGE